MRVLYIDDDRINALLFQEATRLAPELEVHVAWTGAEALAHVRETPPDVLVIDLHLTDTTGYELLPALRALPGMADVPAFLCTADEPARVAEPARAAGFQGCWPKPVDLPTVLGELRRLTRNGPRAE